MKSVLVIWAFALFAGSAFADGVSIPFDDPEVMAPPGADWSGAYVGLSYGQNKATKTTTRTWEEIEEGFDYHEATCVRGTGSSQHENNKCKLNEDLFDALGVPLVKNPWDTAPYKLNDGALTDQLAKYQSGYDGLWLGDSSTGSHTWTLGDVVPTQAEVDALNADTSRDAVLSIMHFFQEDVVTQMSETVTTETSKSSFGAFLGYRHDFGRIVGGAEIGALGDLTTAEAQIGFDAGQLLIYGLGGWGEYDGTSGTIYGAGADLKLSPKVLVGVKYTTGEFDDTDVDTASLRVAYQL